MHTKLWLDPKRQRVITIFERETERERECAINVIYI